MPPHGLSTVSLVASTVVGAVVVLTPIVFVPPAVAVIVASLRCATAFSIATARAPPESPAAASRIT